MRSPNSGLVQETQVMFSSNCSNEKEWDARRAELTCSESGSIVVSQQSGLRVSSIGTEKRGSSRIPWIEVDRLGAKQYR